jgi:hypothetical protein
VEGEKVTEEYVKLPEAEIDLGGILHLPANINMQRANGRVIKYVS